MAATHDGTANLKVFVSYRRADTAQVAGRVFDRLVAAYGRDCVFKDVDSIALGTDFRSAIEESLSRCDAMVVLIGKHWLDAAGERGRRLDDPTDFVRLELEGALARQFRMIPLLAEGAEMPTEAQLPASLKGLAFRTGTVLRPDPDFHRDMERVIQALGPPSQPSVEHTRARANENWHPTVESGFHIRVFSGPMADKVFPLKRTRLIVGRSDDCDIALSHETYSSRVAFDLEWDSSKRTYSLRSMSRNPVLVNDRAASSEPIWLVPGDCIRLGTTVLRYEKAELLDTADGSRDPAS